MSKKVYVVGGGNEYAFMFKISGWKIVEDLKQADLLQFTGGSDVSPSFYGHRKHNTTYNSTVRDQKEALFFAIGKRRSIPMAGICRGGQFLNVMNGGWLWQDVDGHTKFKGHKATDVKTGEVFHVTSTHHQMMSPHKDGEIVLVAQESSFRERMGTLGNKIRLMGSHEQDVEAVYYPKTNCFCFQPHPEFLDQKQLRKHYFNYLDQYLGLRS